MEGKQFIHIISDLNSDITLINIEADNSGLKLFGDTVHLLLNYKHIAFFGIEEKSAILTVQLNEVGIGVWNQILKGFDASEYESVNDYPPITLKIMMKSAIQRDEIYETMMNGNALVPISDDEKASDNDSDDCKGEPRKKKKT